MQNPDCILIFLPLCQLDLMTEKWVVVAAVDPTRLSMEQGKEFLKHLGIPQRDVSAGEAGQVTGGGRRRPPSLEPRQLLPP